VAELARLKLVVELVELLLLLLLLLPSVGVLLPPLVEVEVGVLLPPLVDMEHHHHQRKIPYCLMGR
jgi:hypothetical protein